MKELTAHQKLENIVRAGKPKMIRHEGKTYYISKKKIKECEKEGGILPLLTLIPLIAGGVSAAGGVAGAAAGVAKAVNEKNGQLTKSWLSKDGTTLRLKKDWW